MAENFVPLREQPNQQRRPSSSTNQSSSILSTGDQLRNRYGIEVDGSNVPEPIEHFEQMQVPQRLLHFVKRSKKFTKPTPVQMQSIGCLLQSRDIICLSSTGTGKTYGYLLPMCSFLWKQINQHGNEATDGRCYPKCLIVVPTRELMFQVLNASSELLESSGIFQQQETVHAPRNGHYSPMNQPFGQGYQGNYHWPNQPWMNQATPYPPYNTEQNKSPCVGLCGGVPIKENIDRLHDKPSVVIATPGRLLDLCDKNFISLDKTQFFVIDECDKILEMGMEEQLRKIVAMVTINIDNKNLLTSLWSATLPESLERIARSAVIDPVYICCGLRNSVPQNITQNVQFLHTYQKTEFMLDVLRHTPYPPVIVFASSKEKVDRITESLQEEQFHTAALHSGYPQSHRNDVIESFRNGDIDILVATDLASRGLDIPAVTHILNFDTPDTIQDYIHRVGRTGRFGRAGEVTTLLTLDCKIAEELRGMLEESNAVVPLQLKDLKMFGRKVTYTDMGDRVS